MPSKRLSTQSVAKMNLVAFLIIELTCYKRYATGSMEKTGTRALQVTTKCDSIIIYDSPKIFYDTNGEKIRTVAETIDMVDKIKPFKVRVQNIQTCNSTDLRIFGDNIINNLQSIELRFDSEDQELWELRHIRQVLSTAPSLEELSLIVNSDTISSKAVQRIIESISCEKLKSLTTARVSTSGVDLQEIIGLLKLL